MLPVLGPRTLRSAVGTAFDTYLQMETLGSISDLSGVDSVSGLVALGLVDQRTKLLGKEELLELAALDPYTYMRETISPIAVVRWLTAIRLTMYRLILKHRQPIMKCLMNLICSMNLTSLMSWKSKL